MNHFGNKAEPPEPQTADGAGTAPWGYDPHNGPARWGSLEPAFCLCRLGREQSPIDLTDERWVEPASLEVEYRRSRIVLHNTGHTVQADPEAGSGIVLEGVRHELLQYHFHCRSEHLVDGEPFPMELHFVHRNADGGLAVLGILIAQGKANDALATVWERLPTAPGASVEVPGMQDLASLLPPYRTTWRYRGSLTTPPCTEGVAWVLLDGPLEMSRSQIEAFAAIYPNNFRPVQPLYDRELLRG